MLGLEKWVNRELLFPGYRVLVLQDGELRRWLVVVTVICTLTPLSSMLTDGYAAKFYMYFPTIKNIFIYSEKYSEPTS